MAKEKVFLVDLDDTLAGYTQQLLSDLYNIKSEEEEYKIDFCDFSYKNNPAWLNKRIRMIRSQPGWYLNLYPIEKNFKIIEIAKKIGYKIHVLTKGPGDYPDAWREKLLWCKKYVYYDGITITTDKSLVNGDVLFDDYPDYMLKWIDIRPQSLGIMPVMPQNISFSHKQIVKYDYKNIDEIAALLEQRFGE